MWRRFVQLSDERPDDAAWFTQMLVVEAGRVVGRVRFVRPPEDGEVEIGYVTMTGERGRGVATAAVRLLLLAATRAEVDVVIVRVSADNAASLAVARATGFVDVGEQNHPRMGVPMRRLEHHLRVVPH